jgi:hypothetical protein
MGAASNGYHEATEGFQRAEEVPWLAPIEFDPLPPGIRLGSNGRSWCDRLWISLTERRMRALAGLSEKL